MPSFFLDKPGDEADTQINQLWAYISLGKQMPRPEGLAQANEPPIAPTNRTALAKAGEDEAPAEPQ